MKPQFDWSAFGADVRAKRKAEGLSMRALARAIPVDISVISRAESGKTLTIINFIVFLQWLRKPVHKYVNGGK